VIASNSRKFPGVRQERERIAGFLRLPRVSGPRKQPLAPFAIRRRTKRLEANPFPPRPELKAVVGHSVSTALARTRPGWRSAAQRRQRPLLLAANGMRSGRQSLPEPSVIGRAAQRPSGRTSWKSAVSIPSEKQDWDAGISDVGNTSHATLRMRSSSGHTSRTSGRSSSVRRSFAPVSLVQDGIGTQLMHQAAQSNPVVGPAEAAIDNTTSQPGLVTDARPTPAVAETRYDPSLEQSGLSGGTSGPRSGTIHLDSTSLGRWTVEHLAWTLSREPTGMTGIDPRISAPRSRLSPF